MPACASRLLPRLPLLVVAASTVLAWSPARAAYEDPLWAVQRTNAIKYGEGIIDGGSAVKDLLLDLYEPIGNPDPNKPAMVLIHGGGFTGGSRGSMQAFGDYFAARGYVAVSISYRLLGENPVADPAYFFYGTGLEPAVHAAAVDAKAAIRWVRANADVLGVDENFVIVGGISAGGITSVHVGVGGDEGYLVDLPGGIPLAVNNPGESSRVSAVLDYCGGSNFDYWDPTDPPILIVHTTGDTVVPVALADIVEDQCQAFSIPYEYHRLEGGGHCSFLGGLIDGLTPLDLATRFLNRTLWEVPPQMMPARKLVLRDDPSKPDKRKVVFVAKGDSPTSEALRAPEPGSATDPTLHGATVELYRPSGGSDESVEIALPAEYWEMAGPNAGKGFRYKDKRRVASDVKSVVLKDGLLKIVGKGTDLYPLSHAPQGDFVVRFRLGSGDRWCASTVAGARDTTSIYKAARQSVAPSDCPDRPS